MNSNNALFKARAASGNLDEALMERIERVLWGKDTKARADFARASELEPAGRASDADCIPTAPKPDTGI